MQAPAQLPISESLAVFLGVTGCEWLIEGSAEPVNALAMALAAGVTIHVVRCRRRRKDHRN